MFVALNAALQADKEHQRPDDDGRADDQHPRLPQGLAEEGHHATVEDVDDDFRAELDDLAEVFDPLLEFAANADHD